ncbi:heterogeneous nuclear ribonucleoprotein 1-like [Phalaenopsis equestris]|uniref:heterogeneous nuclear ribonucleoprotein 1-like n=1 Tax=Phalaenopsis equestris TaxID=78828 RepID=UPI0009E4C4CE|nr:heterogeneous nuclear ribonucleoprotein 1-like [Phalaenopsis equestris]XP_020570646.1 heterogeneous nuclear ribonucleoprotein 1-like [Phalaenopsis equestris]
MEHSPSSSSQLPSLVDPAKLFIGGITKELEEDVLKDYFQKFGEVKEVVVMRERATGNVRGFGFIEFFDSEAAERAINEGQHLIRNRSVDVKRARPRPEERRIFQSPHHPFPDQSTHINRRLGRTGANNSNNDESQTSSRKIFVGGLSANVTEVEFRNYFEKFGCITDVVIMYDSATHRPRGFGFITFDTEEAVENVMQKNFHELNKKVVEVKRAVPKDLNHLNNGSSYNGHSNTRGSGGRVSYVNNPHVIYPPHDPRYGYFYGYAPPPVPNYAYGPLGYGGGYTYAGYGGMGYNASYTSPRGTWTGQGGMMAGRRSPVSYPNGGFYPGYVHIGSGGYIGLTSGGYHGAVWSANGKFNQTGTGLPLSEFDSKKPSEFDNVKVDDAH